MVDPHFRYLPQGLQLICQLCQFTAASWDGLKLHAAGEKHQQQYQLYQVSHIVWKIGTFSRKGDYIRFWNFKYNARGWWRRIRRPVIS